MDKDTTKIKLELEKEEQLPQLSLPESVFLADDKKEIQDDTLQDSKDYIGIILKELEDTKKELVQARIPAPEKKNIWKGISIGVLIILVCWVLFFFYTYDNTNKDGSLSPTGTAQEPADTDGSADAQVTEHYIVDLQIYADQIKAEDTAPFTASVETLYGYEYLCFTYENISIYYRNEYLDGDQDNKRVMIDNGSQLSEFQWDYDLAGDLQELIPYYGTYLGNDSYQLLFMHYAEDNPDYPEEMHFVDANSLYNYNTINIKEELLKLFALEYAEEPSAADSNNLITTMKMTVGDAVYNYYISTDNYVDAVYYEANNLSVDKYFDLSISNEGITFNTAVTLPGDEYLGEVSGALSADGILAALTNVKYGTYADPDQEDYGSDGIITPRKSYLYDKIVIGGNNNERYLIAYSDEIGYNNYNWSSWIEEDGVYTYYTGDVPVSIRGIDVSYYQGNIDWEKVKAAGVEFAIIRLGYRGKGEGTLELDSNYLYNVKAASEAGLHVGVYFFSQAINETEASEEADMVLKYIKDYNIDYPVIFDTEAITTSQARANNLTRQERTDLCKVFCDKIKNSGYIPMIYSNTKYMIMGLDLEQLTEYDRWYAYYGENHTFPYDFQMYQYSSQGILDGIEGYVDLDVSFIDYAAEQTTEK